MMYHFIFGLRGASPPATASAGVSTGFASFSVSTAVLTIFSFSASGIESLLSLALTAREIMQHPLQAVLNNEIHNPEIQSKQEHRDNDHRRRCLNFLKRRRSHLLHLRANVVVERLDPLRPGSQTAYKLVLFRHCCRHTFPLSSTAPSRA